MISISASTILIRKVACDSTTIDTRARGQMVEVAAWSYDRVQSVFVEQMRSSIWCRSL